MAHAFDFCFEGGPAGYFLGESMPVAEGVYDYMPYRSGSHYRLHQELRSSGAVRCQSRATTPSIQFTVISWPGYGKLEIADVTIVP